MHNISLNVMQYYLLPTIKNKYGSSMPKTLLKYLKEQYRGRI